MIPKVAPYLNQTMSTVCADPTLYAREYYRSSERQLVRDVGGMGKSWNARRRDPQLGDNWGLELRSQWRL